VLLERRRNIAEIERKATARAKAAGSAARATVTLAAAMNYRSLVVVKWRLNERPGSFTGSV
jgi:hypothetical protein